MFDEINDADDDVCRLLFWTSVGRYQRIESSSLDGTSRRTLVSGGLLSLSSLTVDPDTRRVFWADSGRRRIESASYDGSSRRDVVSERLEEPGAVAVVGRHVYWVDEGTQTVERADKETGADRVVIKTRLTQLTDVVAVVRPHGRCVNACGRLRCSHLCVVQSDGTARCSCPDGMSLSGDSLTCARDVLDCRADEVRCSDAGACAPRCDGVGDCPDLVDEVGCYGSCLFSEFQCLSGTTRCVASSLRCDGRADCDDASDEARCERCVGSEAMLCAADARCIGRESVCDGRRHCSDGEDERHCLPPAGPGAGPRRAAFVVVGSVCGLLLLVVGAVVGVFWRCRRDRKLSSASVPAVSKPASVGLHAMLAAVSSTSCRGGSSYHSPMYDRVPPASLSTTSSSGCTSASSVPFYDAYPRETLNPPPSLCTSQCSASRPRDAMTPCSTDVCDDVDSAAALSRWQLDSVDYETEPLYRPPPPTPYSRHADDDETASASSLGVYFTHDDTATSVTRCSRDDCERHQHSVTRATSPQSSAS